MVYLYVHQERKFIETSQYRTITSRTSIIKILRCSVNLDGQDTKLNEIKLLEKKTK